jgi:hypothetical protein
MPLQCPRCQIAQAEENETCINCGQPLTPVRARSAAPNAPRVDPALLAEAAAAAHLADHDDPVVPDPVHAVQARRASWHIPALVAVGLLLALVASALLVARRRPVVQSPLAAPTQAQTPDTALPVPVDGSPLPAPPSSSVSAPPAAPATPSAGAAVGAVPLTITLASTSAGRHVKVGDAVTFTTFATLPHGQISTLTLFIRRGRGQKSMLSFTQGTLYSTPWTPTTPGRYEFTATALGSRQDVVTSRRIEITVDRPARQTVAQNAVVQSAVAQALPAAAAALPSPRTASLPSPRRAPLRPAARAPRRTAKSPAPALTYHVAAAHFAFSRSATVLADALSRRGYPAVPERMADAQGKTVYVVVTGSFRRPKDARSAAVALQRSGYPAYFFGGH